MRGGKEEAAPTTCVNPQAWGRPGGKHVSIQHETWSICMHRNMGMKENRDALV
jgi:hypothetical protein